MLVNIGATSLDPGIRLMNVSHAQYVILGGGIINYLGSVFFFSSSRPRRYLLE